MSAIPQLDHDHLWHPFTQQREWCEEEPLVIERADGCDLIDCDGRRYIDGVSSLWCNVHGHRHPMIDRALRDQLAKVAHSTMLGLTHPGAAELATRLADLAPGELSRVFYSDSGSTAVEVALKMAFQYWRQRGGQHVRRTSFVRLRDAYHGDTIGSVSVGGIDLFHAAYRPLLFDSHAAEPGDAADMARILAAHEEEIAAVIVEPLVQGAAGMLVHPPGYLQAVRELNRRTPELRTLILSTDPAHSLADAFDVALGDQPTLVADRLWGGELDTRALFSVAYGEIASSIYFALGVLAANALGFTPLVLLAVLIAGAVLGDATGYWIGHQAGKRLFQREDSFWFRREHLEKAERFYERHGGKTIFIARFFSGLRTFAPIVAGAARMTYPRFALFNITGAISWITIVTMLGYIFGNAVTTAARLPQHFRMARETLYSPPPSQT